MAANTTTVANPDDERPDPTRFTHSQAVTRLGEIQAELERLGENDTLTAEDDQYFRDLTDEFDALDEHRRQLERNANLARVRQVMVADALSGKLRLERGSPPRGNREDYDRDAILEPDSIEDHRFRNPWDLSEVRTFGRSKGEVAQELRARALGAIEKMASANDKVREAGTRIIEEFDDGNSSIARMCLATSSPEYLRAWSKVAKSQGHMVSPEEQRALERAMSLTDSAGGYLVPFQLDPTVIISSAGSRNQIRQAARTVVATGDIWNGVSSGAVSWSWDAEGAEVSDDATTFTQPTVAVHKAAGFVPISLEALQDEANVTQEVARLLAFGRDNIEATAFATGTGSGQPFGIITALTGTASEINAATDDVFAIGDVYTLDGSLPARHRAGASWAANRNIYNLIRRFDTSGGAGMWERIGADQPALLLGRPALEVEGMDSTVTVTGAVSNYILVFGDFSNYVIADRVGMTIEFIPHLFHVTTNRPSGSRGWYAHFRVGADSVLDDAFRLLDVPSAA